MRYAAFSANNTEVLSQILLRDERAMVTANGVAEAQNSDQAWPEKMGSDAQKMLQQLSAQMNQVTLVGEWLTVDQERIDRFADVTDDHQWIHTDVVRAKEHSPFGGPLPMAF